MKFELRHKLMEDYYDVWTWDATVQGESVARSPESYVSEQDARSSIAKARKAFVGAKFAKVVAPDAEVV